MNKEWQKYESKMSAIHNRLLSLFNHINQRGLAELIRNAFWSILSHTLSRGIVIFSSILLARHFNVQDFAAFSYFQITTSMLGAYAAMGLGVTASRYFAMVGRGRATLNEAPPPLGALFVTSVITAVIATCGVIFFAGQWLSAGIAVPKMLLALGVFVVAMRTVPGGAVLGLELYRQSTIVATLAAAVMFMGVAYAIAKESIFIAMVSVLFSAFIQVSGEIVLVARYISPRNIFQTGWSEKGNFKNVFGFSGPMLIVSILAVSGPWLLGTMISRQNGAHAFALYSIGLQWFALALVIPGMVSRVILPRIVRAKSQESISTQLLVRQSAVMVTVVALVVAVIVMIWSDQLMSLYGNQYQADRWLIAGFLLAAVFSAPANTIGNAIVADNGQGAWLCITLVWLGTILVIGCLTSSLAAWAGVIALGSGAAVMTAGAIWLALRKKLI